MNETGIIILAHQLVFQGMFIAKNIFLRQKLGQPIRGTNREVNAAIIFFAIFITTALILSFKGFDILLIPILPREFALAVGLLLLGINLVVSGAALLHLKDSWRVGVIGGQQTELISTGIYRYTRNPFFVAYLLMFAAYSILLRSGLLLGLSVFCFWLVHRMVRKEEAYLLSVHGETYTRYKQKVARYLIV